MQLSPKQYEYRTSEFPSMNLPQGMNIGFVEQEFEKIFPQLTRNAASPVMGDSSSVVDFTRFKAINYTGLIPVLTAALQEQQRIIENLEARLSEVERKNDTKSISNVPVDPSGALIQVAPNPANDRLNITLALRTGLQKAELVVLGMNGQEAIREQVSGSGLVTQSIPVTNLKNGTYICSLLCDDSVVATSSFVVNH